MALKLFKVADVCELAQLQPYVLRSWEKEFPGIGVQQSPEGAKSYRQSDVDQVLRIKQLVFGDGLTLAGARRRLEQLPPVVPSVDPEAPQALNVPAAPVEVLAAETRERIGFVREGLRSLLRMLDGDGKAFALQPAAGQRTALGAAKARRRTSSAASQATS